MSVFFKGIYASNITSLLGTKEETVKLIVKQGKITSILQYRICSIMNVAQHLHLKWNDHSTSILQDFLQSLMNEQLVDVTLSCQGQLIKVHKIILSACSPYFQMLFRLHQQKDIVIIVNSISIHHLRLLIEFIYTGEIKIKEHELQEFLQAAEQLQIKSLYDVIHRRNLNDNSIHPSNSPQVNSSTGNYYNTIQSGGGDANLLSESMLYSEVPLFNISNNEKGKSVQEDINATDSSTRTSKINIDDKENEQELEFYNAKHSIKQSDERIAQKRPYVKKQQSKIRRPPNAFMVFANQWRRKLATEHTDENNKEISVRLGYMWRNLGSDEKAQYYQESRRVDEEHKLKYPGYYYSPMEARKMKKHRNDQPNKRNPSSELERTPCSASEKTTTPDRNTETPVQNYDSSESTEDAKYDTSVEYKPEMCDVINAVIGMGVTNCIIDNNNIVTKAEIEPNIHIKTET